MFMVYFLEKKGGGVLSDQIKFPKCSWYLPQTFSSNKS